MTPNKKKGLEILIAPLLFWIVLVIIYAAVQVAFVPDLAEGQDLAAVSPGLSLFTSIIGFLGIIAMVATPICVIVGIAKMIKKETAPAQAQSTESVE